MYGRTYMGANGTTFISDPEGTVGHVISKVSPKTHDDEVLLALGELSAA
jgi:peroxiredoxin Q/BCP